MLLRLLSACLLVTSAAVATTFRHMPFEELVLDSQAVVRARSLSSESHWERGEIWTFTNFEVSEGLKGNIPRLVTVRTPGGKAGHLRSIVEGAPQFRDGEEVYLFLAPGSAQPFQILGWAQGTFRIRTDSEIGQETVTQDSAGMEVFDSATHKFRRDGIKLLPIELFRKRINALIDKR